MDEIEVIRGRSRTRRMPFQGKWNTFRDYRGEMFYDGGDDLFFAVKGGDRELWEHLLEDYDKNRLSYFLPHGPTTTVDGRAHAPGVTEGHAFINDWTNGICLVVAPTRVGKSCLGMAWSLFRVLPCEATWHCFTDHGIHFHEWRGPRKLVISSYSWSNVNEVWEEYRKFCPRRLLGRYAPEWGKYPGETGRAATLSFDSGKTQRLPLYDGDRVVGEFLFLCDGQRQGAWEGKRWDEGQNDEQREREKFIGYLRGTSNTEGVVQCCFTLTGHVLPDRPDTGAAGWIKRELWDGTYTFGRSVGRYHLDIESTPDAVLPPERKAELRRQWVDEPERNNDEETRRKGEARYFGRWESGGGLVLDNFSPDHHIVPPLLKDCRAFQRATLYRGMDHGLGRPATCAWAAVFEWGDVLFFREYYKPGGSIPLHSANIVELSGNQRVREGLYEDPENLVSPRQMFRESFIAERYHASVLDCRSFASPSQEYRNLTMGQLYNQYGLWCTAGKNDRNNDQLENFRAYLRLQPDRPHLMHTLWKRGAVTDAAYKVWLAARNGVYMNAPMVYFTDAMTWTFREINKFALNPKTGRPITKDDHLVNGAVKYVLAERPVWVAPQPVRDDREDEARRHEFKFVGY